MNKPSRTHFVLKSGEEYLQHEGERDTRNCRRIKSGLFRRRNDEERNRRLQFGSGRTLSKALSAGAKFTCNRVCALYSLELHGWMGCPPVISIWRMVHQAGCFTGANIHLSLSRDILVRPQIEHSDWQLIAKPII